MNGFNKVIIAGNLTRDPELRFLPSGSAIASFDIAVNRKWTQDGEKKEEVTFVPITSFGKQAETIGQYLKKGNPILIEGRLRQESWTDKTTQQKRTKLSVVAESFTFLDSGGSRDTAAPSGRPKAPPTAGVPVGNETPPEEDDVPF